MKLLPLLFGVSLVANATLLLVVYRPSLSSKSESAPSVALSSSAAPSVKEEPVAMSTTSASSTVTKPVSWPDLRTASLTDMVARLRAAGFPPSALRAFVWARVNEQMAAKRKAMLSAADDTPFWKVKRPAFDSKFMIAQREFYEEQSKLVKAVLGADAVEENDFSAFFRKRQYGDISRDKEEKLQRVTGDYNDLRNTIYAETSGMLMPEDREKLAYLEKEMRQDLAEILTPTEMENYELRSSTAANDLRYQLTTFQPTEAEFRALFQATRIVDEKFGSGQMGMTIDQRQQRTAALNEQAKLALSPERYAQFAQATDPANSTLNRIVSRYNLPETVVPQVNAVQKDIQQRVAALRQLPAAQQTEQAQALQKEATNKLQPLLGDTAFQAYRIYGGQWLDQITRPPTGPFAGTPPTGAAKAGGNK